MGDRLVYSYHLISINASYFFEAAILGVIFHFGAMFTIYLVTSQTPTLASLARAQFGANAGSKSNSRKLVSISKKRCWNVVIRL